MDNALRYRFSNLMSNSGVPHNAEHKFHIEPTVLEVIETTFEEYQKVSIAFLFFQDIKLCFRICQKCIADIYLNFLTDNHIFDCSNWDIKLLECFYYIKHFQVLNKLGVAEYDAIRYYKAIRFVSEERYLFYKICENLSAEETKKAMESIPQLSPEKYLEMYILKVISSKKYLESFRRFLYSLNNPTINSFLKLLFHDKNDVLDGNPGIQPPIPKLLRIKKEDVYPIKNPENVGVCFIINEVNIKNLSAREGSDKDASSLESTFKSLHFDVITFKDVPKKFFEEDFSHHIDSYFKEDHSVFVMVILSHGLKDAIISCDNKAVSISYIKYKLSVKPQLYKIPKVLIVQACQGEKILLAERLETDGSTIDLASGLDYDDSSSILEWGTHISDFLLAKATVPGFRALRNRVEGSFFIQSLCHCIREYESDSVTSIITKTIKMVKDQPVPITNSKIKIGQQPEMTTLLDKELYFKLLSFD